MPPRGSPTAAEELKHPRKNPRRGGSKVSYFDKNSPLDDLEPLVEQDDDDSEVEAPPSSEEEEEETESDYEVEMQIKRRTTRSAARIISSSAESPLADRRVSSRANKSQATYDDSSDCDENDGETSLDHAHTKRTSPEKQLPAKASARRPKQSRPSTKSSGETSDYCLEDDLDSCKGEGSEKENSTPKEFDPFKIQKIIASRTEPRSFWTKLCKKNNTSVLHHGSRWVQDPDPTQQNESALEERFLVKWGDLSYMHCSWETRKDLLQFIENAKAAFSSFERKSDDDGYLFTADERCDGDYFHPAWTQIDRILEVHCPEGHHIGSSRDQDEDVSILDLGIVLDTNDPAYENGLGRQLLIKWGDRPYSEFSYEFERDLILNDIDYKSHLKAFHQRTTKLGSKEAQRLHSDGEAEVRRLYKDVFGDRSDTKRDDGIKGYQALLQEMVYKNGGKLRDYQSEGVAWLMNNFINKRSSILADEMGLGKTIQLAAFINILATKFHRRGPFLIVVPLTTLGNWKRELDGWLDLNTIVYHGSARDRAIIREFEMAYPSDRPKKRRSNAVYLKSCATKTSSQQGNPWMAEVILTTPEVLCANDYTELASIKWEVIIVDEAHRLKNHSSKFAANVRDSKFHFGHKILLTGTPIQNTMQELFALLNFVAPDLFKDCGDFLAKYGDMKSKDCVDELHDEIRPYILRRLKEDVEKSVPPKEETVIEVELTLAQKQYYRALYEKNVKFLRKNKRKALDGPSLNNLAMQLRKCCNHLFLLHGIEEEFRAKEALEEQLSDGDLLVKASGKLVLMDKLLPRLKENGHRVLLFSQFKIMLDVLEDYLNDRGFRYERIDGSITGNQRQQAIDRYQAEETTEGQEQPFVMLLSTRAGGVGINLTAADTCVIFDSDWNPQNDLQAQARCHRIGQTKSVKVYRLLTRKTYEMQMFHMSSLKMGLDQAVLSGFEAGSSGEGALTKEEIERLLKHGAYDIFNEERAGAAEAESNAFIEQDIDTILERRSKVVVYENSGSQSTAAGGTFSKASFTAAKGTGRKNTQEDVDVEDPDFWRKMVGEGPEENEKEDLPGKRNRTVSNYCESEYDKKIAGSFMESEDEASVAVQDDESFQQGEESESEDEDDDLLDDSILVSHAPGATARKPQHVQNPSPQTTAPAAQPPPSSSP